MRTETEIRAALAALGGPENDEPRQVGGGVLMPRNAITRDALRWVLGEPSDFGDAMACAAKQIEAFERGRKN